MREHNSASAGSKNVETSAAPEAYFPKAAQTRAPNWRPAMRFGSWRWLAIVLMAAVAASLAGSPWRAGSAATDFASNSATFNATEDTTVNSKKPDLNYGQRTTVQADWQPGIKVALLRFDLSSIPADATITLATIHLYVTNSSDQAGTLDQVSGDWSEASTTWSNAPQVGPLVAAISGRAVSDRWVQTEVTSGVEGAGDADFYLVSTSPDGIDYASSESFGRSPTLTVEWLTPLAGTAGGSAPAPVATSTPAPTVAPTVEPTPTSAPIQQTNPTATASPTPQPTPTPPPPSSSSSHEGRIRFLKKADGAMDKFNTSSTWQPVINARYQGMMMFPPYSDRFTFYTGEGFFYLDAYAVYVNSGTNPAGANMTHVLRNSAGAPCYIPWGSPYTQYAADVGNQDFRNRMVNYIKAKLAAFPQYDGVYLDDVNLDLSRVACSGGPIDPRTGQVMTNDNWKRYFVEFLEQVRSSTTEKVAHNTVWYLVPFDDPYLAREIRAADYVEMEQGFVDRGLTGSGAFAWTRKMQFVDLVHSLGANLIDHDIQTSSDVERDYGLANYLLFSDGTDFYSTFWEALPDQDWTPYSINLGAALGARYQVGSSWRRDFTGGYVIVNPPPTRTASIVLGSATPVTATPTPTPTPTATPAATPTPIPSPTVTPQPTATIVPGCELYVRIDGVDVAVGRIEVPCINLIP